MLTIGLDVGTQGTKALVYDVNAKAIVGRGAVSYGLISTRHGQAEQEPSTWIQACKDALSQALAGCKACQVRGIAVSGQQHGLVVLDSNGTVIRPAKLWCDLESAAEAQEISELYKTTIVPSITITKLLWLKRHEPENYSRIAHVLLPHDYINYWLTGAFTMECSDSSGIGIFNPETHQWNLDRINAVDPNIINWIPEKVLKPDEPAGILRADVAAELGLPSEGVVVGPGGGDNAMSALGVGAVEEGVWIISLGTSGTLFGPAKKPISDTSGTICEFCDASGQALPLLCTVNCTGVTEEVRKLCGLDHNELAALASKEAPGCEGVTFLPYLGGERTPNWPHARGTILGLQPGQMRPGLLYRAAMEGATFSLLQGLIQMKDHGVQASELRLVGGGSRNATWRQVIADAFQLPLRFPVEPESAALGAALQAAAVASEMSVAEFTKTRGQPEFESITLQPHIATAKVYNRAFEQFQRLGSSLFGENGVFQEDS